MTKTKALISCAVTAQLVCVFVFAYAKSRFSHNEAQICLMLVFGWTNFSLWLSETLTLSMLTASSPLPRFIAVTLLPLDSADPDQILHKTLSDQSIH